MNPEPILVEPGVVVRGRSEEVPDGYGKGTPSSAGPATDRKPRCRYCARVIAYYVTRPWRIKCAKCGAVTSAE